MSPLHLVSMFLLPCAAVAAAAGAIHGAFSGDVASVVLFAPMSACLVGVWAAVIDEVRDA